MKTPLTILALMGCLQAQTYLVGSVWGDGNWHKVYISDEMLTVATNHNTTMLAHGTYRAWKDGSPGYITIARQDLGSMANILAHELCHAIQDDRHIKLSEYNCR